MCLLRKYGLTMLPIFRHFFHFPKQRLCYPHQTLHPLRGHKKRSLQISRHVLGKDDNVDWRLLKGWSIRSRDQNGGLWLAWSLDGWHAERRCEGWSSFFLFFSVFLHSLFSNLFPNCKGIARGSKFGNVCICFVYCKPSIWKWLADTR